MILNLVMSIKPIPFKDIASGDKKIEYRFTFPRKLDGKPAEWHGHIIHYVIWIMEGRIVGKSELLDIKTYNARLGFMQEWKEKLKSYEYDYIMNRTGKVQGYNEIKFYGYELGKFTKLDLPLSALGLTRAPQSWQYTEVEL